MSKTWQGNPRDNHGRTIERSSGELAQRITITTKMLKENKTRGGKTIKRIAVLGVVVLALMASLLVGCAGTPEKTPDVPDVITLTFPRVSDYCTIDVDYPSEREGNLPIPEGFVTVRKGGAVTLPVTIKSLVDKPIKIRLTLSGVYPPEFVECEYPKGYMTLNPGETIDTQITVKALENAQTGDYTSREEAIGVNGYLQEPELGKIFSVFYLSIVD